MFEKHRWGVPPDRNNIILIAENLSHCEAIDKEIELIAHYGRIDLGTGILRNLTDGGEGGGYGRIVTKEQRIKSSKSNRGQKRSKQTRQNMVNGQSTVNRTGKDNPFYNKKHTTAALNAMSAKKKGKTWEEIYGVEGARLKREATSNTMTGKIRGPKKKVECPHCQKIGGDAIMKRWHFDNCKFKKVHS